MRFPIFFLLIGNLLWTNPTIKEIFTLEYEQPLNAPGSSFSDTAQNQLLTWMKNQEIECILDAGCGIFPWIPPIGKYLGIDIVDSIILNAKERLSDRHVKFAMMDITDETLPQGDLILCRDTCDFFSFRDIGSTFQKFKDSKSSFLALSTYPKISDNAETTTGMRRKLNFQAFPFFFPEPLALIEDENERYLGIWKLEEIDLESFEKRTFPPITFLTKPVGGSFINEHTALVNSARRGMKEVHRNFNFNPNDVLEVKEHVVVITDLRAGTQAYEWKKENKIKTLMAGPNFAPSEGNFFIAWPLLNCYLCNSEWPATSLLRVNPSMENRIRYWYAGVEETFWKPKISFKDKNSKKVLVYSKTDSHLASQAQRVLEQYGYTVVMISYGGYNYELFKNILEECKFAVFVSRSESQGLALAEAWCMDVPVLAWNPKAPFTWDGITWNPVSSCPYLNPMVGADWKEIEEFATIIKTFDEISKFFQPRRWVLLNMSDKTSIERLMCHIREYRYTP